jgi:hypothetical protein
MTSSESQLEEELLQKLAALKYEYRKDIRDRAALEKNFREKFEALNHVRLTEAEMGRLLDEITTPDVFNAAHTLRNRTSFTRDDGTPLNYTLVNPRNIGHAVCIDTGACHPRKGGWLTCLDTVSGQVWQANELSQTRKAWIDDFLE